jgi:hypothetical protein
MSDPISAGLAALQVGTTGANLAGSAKGGGSPQNVNFPPFFSVGGITPEQQALADYGLSEADVATGAAFGNSGTGMSTMATQAGTGNRMGKAIAEGKLSDTNQDAMLKAFENNQTAAIQGISNESTLSNLATQNLTNLINQAGKASTTAAGNADFTQGAADIFNTTG